MTRKGKKAPGGHNPLTYHERSKLTSYGTQTTRLSTDSQKRFGDCCLGLEPAIDPVATPSGHIYSREAIVAYLLTKSRELKQLRSKYESKRTSEEEQEDRKKEVLAIRSLEDFEKKDQGAIQQGNDKHSKKFSSQLGKKISTETSAEGRKTLKRTSYWLSENQPIYDSSREILLGPPPPDRPPSPMSGEPLRLKDLTSLSLGREEGNSGNHSRCVCSVSGKAITTQPVVALKRTGHVVLKSVYDELVKPTMICPFSEKKIKEKDVLILKKAATAFSASGKVEAKKYRHTLT